MKFLNYITENLREDMTIEEINSLIQKDCGYYLNLIKNDHIFKRGLQKHINLHGKKQVRQDRKPRGMNSDAFKKFNKWLDQNGHVRRDKAVIAANISDGLFENLFGNVYYIFPIGKFDYTWLMAEDMNIKDYKTGWYEYAVENFFTQGEKTFDDDPKINLNKPFREYFTTNKNWYVAWKNKYEIWFSCKEYYYFDSRSFKWVDGQLSWRE